MTSLPPGHTVVVVPDGSALVAAAARRVLAAFATGGGTVRLALAGGGTPRALYARLGAAGAEQRAMWRRAWITSTDERCVPPDHPDSNHGLLAATLLHPLGLRDDQSLRLRGEDSPEAAAAAADAVLRERAQRVPLFDLVLLGIGEDGHTASLFPAGAWPDFGARRVVATRHPNGSARLSLTPDALRSTMLTLFLAAGGAKAGAVRDALFAEAPSSRRPARAVTAGAPVTWLLDPAAASALPDAWRTEDAA